ncbi:MAG: ATP-binding protein [Gammaproteobacteria bacterium]|jgi:lon-related putative ATP-dependent protease
MNAKNNKVPAMPAPLTAEQVVMRCTQAELGFTTTTELEPLPGILGQSRALQALKFGSRMDGDGFNIYVLGNPGSHRHHLVSHFLQEETKDKAQPFDWCYVNNFSDPVKPRGIALPPGEGTSFKQDMTQLLEDLQASIPAAFESESYRNRLAEIEEEFSERVRKAQEEVQAEAEEAGLGLLPTPSGFGIAPVRDGRPLPEKEFMELPEEERKRAQEAIERISERMTEVFRNMPKLNKERRQRIKELDNNVTMFAVGSLLEDLRKRYADNPAVIAHLDAVQQDVLDNTEDFSAGESGPQFNLPGMQADKQDRFRRYEVNLLIDNAATEGAPVIYENHPTYQNLIGHVEHTSQFGALVTDFNMIRPGALHRANGGYLILDVDKVLMQPYAWDGLKRAIQDKEIRIESIGQLLSLVSTQGLEPDAMPLDIKIVLIGNRLLYYLLCELDPDFPQFFKVAADFEDRIARSPENLQLYARMLASVAKDKALRPFDVNAIARVIDEGSRWASDQAKLTTKMRMLTDLMCEADFCAGERESPTVDSSDVEAAIAQRISRHDRIRSELYEAIERNTIHVSTEGTAIGQVNGLSVLQLSDYMFGQPSRITATARMGAGKVIDIEREVELGGAIHSKGVMILSAYLGARYTSDVPLSLTASLVFEQSYGAVDGDSASVAELVALLSAIAAIPVHQSMAITGSMDQHGRVQAIGGVNQKIEGFFDVCSARGLTGKQGVLIPADNVQHLMLRSDVAAAIADGRFRVYPLNHVDQAIALLTGCDVGEADAHGRFPKDSVNGRVAAALQQYASKRKDFAADTKTNSADKAK